MALIHRILKKPFLRHFEREWRWPEDVAQEGWDAVSIKSASGSNLKAIFGASQTKHVLGVIVLAHPMRKAAKGFWLKSGHAELFRNAGYHVLAFDFNGFGESQSTTFDYPSDVIAAGEYIKHEYSSLDIAVVGASFGAAWSICAMSRTAQPFKAAILEASFPTLSDFWQRYPFPNFMLKASKFFFPAWEKALRPLREADNIKGHPSILLIYGAADEFTPPSHGKQLFDVMRHHADVELWVVEGATHTSAYLDEPDLYRERVLNYLERALTG